MWHFVWIANEWFYVRGEVFDVNNRQVGADIIRDPCALYLAWDLMWGIHGDDDGNRW